MTEKTCEQEFANDFFGVCRECGEHDGYVNIGSDHWMYCSKHRRKWLIGGNLFSDWRHETEDDWRRNREFLSGFTGVAAKQDTERASEEDGNTTAPDAAQDAIHERFHTFEMSDGFHVIEVPGRDAAPFTIWSGPFRSPTAAGFYIDKLVAAYRAGEPGVPLHRIDRAEYDTAAELHEALKVAVNGEGKLPTDLRALALELAPRIPSAHRNAKDDGLPF